MINVLNNSNRNSVQNPEYWQLHRKFFEKNLRNRSVACIFATDELRNKMTRGHRFQQLDILLSTLKKQK